MDKIDAVTGRGVSRSVDLFSEFWTSQVGSEGDDEESSFSGSENEDGDGEEDSGEEDRDEEMQDEPAGEERALKRALLLRRRRRRPCADVFVQLGK